MAEKKSTIATAISLINSGKKYPVINLARDNPGVAAALSKLISPRVNNSTHDNKGNRTLNPSAINGMGQISKELSDKSREFQSMTELFPETELAAQILVSCVISPKDMTKGDINIVAGDDLRSFKISAELLKILKDYFEKDYKIKPLLPKILRSVLVEQGSDPHVVIPENAIDDLINGSSRVSMESIASMVDKGTSTFKSKGVLGNPDNVTKRTTLPGLAAERFNESSVIGDYRPEITFLSKENKTIKTNIMVVDDPSILKLPKLLDKNREQAVKSKLGIGKLGVATESSVNDGFTDIQLTGLLYKRKSNSTKPFEKIRPDSEMGRLTIGAPLVMRFPSSAVIPVYTPGNEENHIGYFLLLDGDGNPLSEHSGGMSGDMTSGLNNQSTDMGSYMMQRSKDGLMGRSCTTVDVRQATRVYADIVESDLLARVRNGVVGKSVSVARNEDIYRLMLARHFSNQMTQLLYVPIELCTYFAFRYDARGIGISLLNSVRHLNTLRAMLLFSGVMARVRNSIGTTQVEIKLDDIDGDPSSTIEMTVHEFMKLRQMNFPTGFTSPGDIYDWVSRAGYEFHFTGHPGLPDMDIRASEGSRSYTNPDNELEDELRKRTVMSMGLSPETVDNAFSGDFATTVVANNVLLAKRVSDIQEVMVPQLTDHMRKVAINDGNLITRLKKVVEDNYDELEKDLASDDDMKHMLANKNVVIRLIVSEFLSNFEAQLPQPDSITIENQSTALDAYVEAVDKVVTNYISSDIFTSEFGGEASSKADEVKNMLKSYFIRKWMAENNFMDDVVTGLNDLVSSDTADSAREYQIHADHINRVSKLVVTLLKDTRGVSNAADRDIERITGGEDLSSSEVSQSQPDYDSGGGGDADFDLGEISGFDDTGTDALDQSSSVSETTEESSSTTTDESGNVTQSSNNSSSSTQES